MKLAGPGSPARDRTALGGGAKGRSQATGLGVGAWAVRAGALLLGALSLGLFLDVVVRRIGYPYDLEWMEGGMLCHALRLLHHQSIYVPPSVDFVPHLYTPLYPAVVAGLGWLAGDVSYGLARAVSLAAFSGALAVGVLWAFRVGGSLPAALVALALPLAAFPVAGGWYDLARNDSLQIFLTVLGALVAWRGRDRHGQAALAAVLLVLAFLAKQTAAPLIAFAGVGLLVGRRQPVLTLALCGVGLFGLSIYALDRASSGWFWTYIFSMHQSHAFYSHRAFVETPLTLLRTLGPALVLLPWALVACRRDHGDDGGLPFLCWFGLGGVVASCISFGTQWAHVNALIPGIFFPSLAIGAAAGRLANRPARLGHGAPSLGHGAPIRQMLVFALLCGSLLPRLADFKPAAHLPTAADRAAGDALIARLRAVPGEVLIPFHPFYAHLAGKRTYLHRMGVWDMRGTQVTAGLMGGLAQALHDKRFAAIVFDQKIEGTWGDWPGVLESYHIVERFHGPREVEGAQTEPSMLLFPNPAIDREIQ